MLEFIGTKKKYKGGSKLSLYLCKCIRCGNTLEISGGRIKSLSSKRCGRCPFSYLPAEEEYLRRVEDRYRWNAKRKGNYYELTREEFRSLIAKNCHYCDALPGNGTDAKYSGIDRVDNSVGYIYSNCVPCCKTCNRMKNNLGSVEFFSHIGRMYAHMYSETRWMSA